MTRKTTLIVGLAAMAALVGVRLTMLSSNSGSPVVASADPAASPASVAQLVEAAKSPDAEARRVALSGLSRTPTPEHRPIFEAATRDGDASVRAVAISALSAYPGDDAAKAIEAAVASEKDMLVRRAAIDALGAQKSERAWVALLETAEKSPDPDLQLMAMSRMYRKLGADVSTRVDPMNGRMWRSTIERIKGIPAVQKAHASCGVKLVRNPGDRVIYACDVARGDKAEDGKDHTGHDHE